MTWVSLNLTAESKLATSVLGYCSQTHTIKDILGRKPRAKAIGFCQNSRHRSRYFYDGENIVYKVKGLSDVAYAVTKDQSKSICVCGRSLFWSTNYTRIEMNYLQFRARKLAGLK